VFFFFFLEIIFYLILYSIKRIMAQTLKI